MHIDQNRKTRLAAVDMDGTLLGPDKTVSTDNRAALARLAAAGFHVAIASGRHHLNVLPIVAPITEVEWIISEQGAEVSDLLRRTTLFQAFLEPDAVRHLITLGQTLGYGVLIYAHEGVFALSSGEWVGFYASLSGCWPRAVPEGRFEACGIYKVLWLGPVPAITAVSTLPEVKALDAYRVQTHEHIVEFLSPRVSKAVGAAALAKYLDVPQQRVVTFGDGENDIPMFEWSGISVAMPDGWPAAVRAATHVAPPGRPDSAFARGVDLVLQVLNLNPAAA